ncbi:phosphorylase family protein [Aurantiacibacter sp. MUD61]|uniref:phosphorylase family protein n=1 Tax=Aurantiacibacter sp. MUD61 TaxID=3009083 RepID=UPI0022F0C841|nr:hypothetical protein [Aurantiacibacter sp. MUD61]
MSDFAIFVALPEELGAALDVLKANGTFKGSKSDIDAKRTRFLYKLGNGHGKGREGTVYLIHGMGNTRSAAFVGSSVAQGSAPAYALLIGISGSLDHKSVKLGDVVISAHVKYYAPDKIKDCDNSVIKTLMPTDASKVCDPNFTDQVSQHRDGEKQLLDGRDTRFSGSFYRYVRQSINRDSEEFSIDKFMMRREEEFGEKCARDFSLHSGSILGSNMVLDSSEYLNYLLEKNDCWDMDFYHLNNPSEFNERCRWDNSKLLAVDMESFGFFSAFQDISRISQGTHAVAVRGISDLAAGKESQDKSSKGDMRRLATQRAVQVGLDYLHEQFKAHSFKTPRLT